MSRYLGESNDCIFELGDTISFDYDEMRLTGTVVVRVYNTRLLYHVEVNGHRYEVEVPTDNPKKVE